MNIRPVILSGGSGTRLWPASRRSLPKQFIGFPAIGSLFTHTLLRVAGLAGGGTPLVISSRQHGFLCRREAKNAGVEATYILEEGGRNTAPAIYFAALASELDDVLLVMPSLSLVSVSRCRSHESWTTGGCRKRKCLMQLGCLSICLETNI